MSLEARARGGRHHQALEEAARLHVQVAVSLGRQVQREKPGVVGEEANGSLQRESQVARRDVRDGACTRSPMRQVGRRGALEQGRAAQQPSGPWNQMSSTKRSVSHSCCPSS